ncbi:magnesium transporter NIPA-domain-containing protein, partial [Neohortaea acidophila]
MYLPTSPLPLAPSSESPVAKWSSTIGIVTAICGNVLISFALNTQRYAHLRLTRDREQQEEKKQRQQRKKQAAPSGYGTQQNDIAKDRAKANAQAHAASYTLQASGESDETDPLIPTLDKRKKSKQAESSDSDDEDGSDASTKNKSYLKSPIWWAGIAMMTVGETGNFLAYGFAPASIVSPLGVVALVSNCLIAPWLLHERFRLRDGLGVVIAVAGCVTVVLSASDSNPKLTPDSIWHLITRWEFETYLGITVFLIIVLCVASDRFGEKSILIDLGLMGLFGGYTALSTKGVASLLSNTIWRAITFPITYLLVAVLAFTAVMQIKYVNRALQRFNSTQVIPIQFVLFTLSVITGSAVLYRDFERTSTEDAVKFVGGCALTFLGVWCITSGRGDES